MVLDSGWGCMPYCGGRFASQEQVHVTKGRKLSRKGEEDGDDGDDGDGVTDEVEDEKMKLLMKGEKWRTF